MFCTYMFLDQSDLGLVYRQHARFGKNATDMSTLTVDSSVSEASLEGANLLKTETEEGAIMTLFSYTQFEPFKSRALIRTPTSSWSKPISLEATGSEGVIDLSVENSSESFQLGLSITIGQGRFYRTKVLRLTPRYMVVNETGEALSFQQCLGAFLFSVSLHNINISRRLMFSFYSFFLLFLL